MQKKKRTKGKGNINCIVDPYVAIWPLNLTLDATRKQSGAWQRE